MEEEGAAVLTLVWGKLSLFLGVCAIVWWPVSVCSWVSIM